MIHINYGARLHEITTIFVGKNIYYINMLREINDNEDI